jgi:hypothetical protein
VAHALREAINVMRGLIRELDDLAPTLEFGLVDLLRIADRAPARTPAVTVEPCPVQLGRDPLLRARAELQLRLVAGDVVAQLQRERDDVVGGVAWVRFRAISLCT